MGVRKLNYYQSYSDFHEQMRKEHLRKTREKLEEKTRRYKRKRKIQYVSVSLVACCLIFGLLSLLVFRYATIFEINYNIQGLEREIHLLELEKEDLYAQMDSTVVLKNVEMVAIHDLGMQYPKAEQIVYLNQRWDYKLADNQKIFEVANDLSVDSSIISNNYMAYIQLWLSDD